VGSSRGSAGEFLRLLSRCRNGTWTELEGTYVGRVVSSWLVLVWGGGVGGGLASRWGLGWGAKGSPTRKKGGGACTGTFYDKEDLQNGSHAVRRNICAFLMLSDVHRNRTRNTRSAWDENEKDELGVSGEKVCTGRGRLECSSTNLDAKTHQTVFVRRRQAVLHGECRLDTAIKNPDGRDSVGTR
jgi:hypothetical protein